jgi:enterobactin synthetase component D
MEPLHLMPDLFPAGVAVSACRLGPDAEDELRQLRQAGALELPKELAGAAAKRRVDFCAGRFCARQALGQVALDLAELAITIGPNREPLWPAGIVGSIAHTRGHVIAAAGHASTFAGIGVDVEHWLDEGAPQRLASDLTVDDELAALVEATGWPPERVLTLVFSAKEALYKCLFPSVQQYFGFQGARVITIAPEAGAFAIALTRQVGHAPAGSTFSGRFECLEAVVVTALATAAP